MNDFYKQPLFLQWMEAIFILVIGFFPALVIIELTYDQPAFSLLFLLYIPVGQFSNTPIFKLTRVYKYYSPMLLGYMANEVQIDLHSGTSFDYLFVMRKHKAGIEFRKTLLTYHLQGLLYIISQIENDAVPNTVNIVGTSYFFNERTLNKVGFEIETPSLFYRLNLFANAIDLIWMYSLSQGKLSMPKIWQAKKASISGSQLVANKEVIELLYNRMISKFFP
ncbi:hypothetical protein [Flavobacterium sp.]|uniref:hypothetical protein n=1 Tax=Flavobacterium sp. TaxID=239 RepID=UPI00286E6934|nr:hypothetical protein [Flavobacterium sp.]